MLLFYLWDFYLRSVAVVLVRNRLLLDVEGERDTTVLDGSGLCDVLVTVGGCFEHFIGHLSGNGTDTLIILDGSAEVGKTLLLEATDLRGQRMVCGCRNIITTVDSTKSKPPLKRVLFRSRCSV